MKKQLTTILAKTQEKAPLFRSAITSALALAIAVSAPALATSKITRVQLVRLNSSDCVNSNVTEKSGQIGGLISVRENEGKDVVVNVHLEAGTPHTKYNLFLKCKQKLGTVYTNEMGFVDANFKVSKAILPSVFAFDMYPDGAPAGNKYQSIQIRRP